MTNDQIQEKLQILVRDERKITKEILELIVIADQRKIYLERGFGSLFEWLTQFFGYSDSAAQRRIQAARLLMAVPEVNELVVSGAVNLSTLSKTQSVIRQQEKIRGQRLSAAEKAQAVKAIENLSSKETEKMLFSIFPEASLQLNQQRVERINESQFRVSVILDEETVKSLEEIKNHLSHIVPSGDLKDVVAYIARDFLAKRKLKHKNKDFDKSVQKLSLRNAASDNPSRGEMDQGSPVADSARNPKPTAAAAKRCVIKSVPAQTKRIVFQRAQNRCEYVDRKSGRRCASPYQLQIDHIIPRAIGGGNELSNLRCLCRQHNLLAAEHILGGEAARFWRPQ